MRTGLNDKVLSEPVLQPGDLPIETDSISRVEIRSAIESLDWKPDWDE